MAELIPSYRWDDIKALTPDQRKRLKSCEVIEGEHHYILMNPQTDYIKMQTEYKAQLSNSVGGETLEEIIGDKVVTLHDKRVAAMAYARGVKKQKEMAEV